ncbi:winged helix-turn-helix domain-containing protein [Thermoplasma volcanium]|nr:helix-turn-helix domain-containing protein [Thermoplasma volcanium]
MPEKRNADLLFRGFSKTRLMVITLIAVNGPMTVTQLSKVIKTTRSNLYQAIKEMVSDGILVQTRTVSEKNYVEKFYDINTDLFDAIKYGDIRKAIEEMDEDKLRNILYSFLRSASAILSIMAEQVNLSNKDDLDKYVDYVRKNLLIISFSTHSTKDMSKFSSMLSNFFTEIDDDNDEKKDEHLLYIVGFPILNQMGFISKSRHEKLTGDGKE